MLSPLRRDHLEPPNVLVHQPNSSKQHPAEGQGGPPIQNRTGRYGTVQDRTGQDRGLRHWTDDEMQSVAVCSAYAEEDVKCSQQ